MSPRDEPAAILFTSGSTGVAKGAVYTHGNFAAQVECLKATYGIEPGEIDLCTFPLFALFGPALGMTCVIPDMNPSRPATINPRKAAAQIRQFGVTNLFGSPAVIRRLGELDGTTLATLRRVISAGAGGCSCHRALRETPARVSRGLHPLRRDRGPAGREYRQPRDSGRDAGFHGTGQGRLRRPAGRGNASSRDSDLR